MSDLTIRDKVHTVLDPFPRCECRTADATLALASSASSVSMRALNGVSGGNLVRLNGPCRSAVRRADGPAFRAKPNARRVEAQWCIRLATVRNLFSRDQHFLPIRFLPTPPRCRVLPGTGVKLCGA
jgi:hypothetical protein